MRSWDMQIGDIITVTDMVKGTQRKAVILSGCYLSHGRVSNFWNWEYLDTKERDRGYNNHYPFNLTRDA